MRTATLAVERSGLAAVQDLGRYGYADIGIGGNGAGDHRSARTANALVGNADDAALIEVIGSDLDLVTDSDLILAVCGAADSVLVSGHPWPSWEALFVPADARIRVPAPRTGQRSYLALNGIIQAGRAFGSVAPDPLLNFEQRLVSGERLILRTAYDGQGRSRHLPVLRLGARRSSYGARFDLQAIPGPDLERLAQGVAAIAGSFEVLPQSDHIGVRLSGKAIDLNTHEEILSRGVPVGAVEVPPSGELIILMRGRLVTAGYPVVGVLTTASIDLLSQARPGDEVRLALVDLASARQALLASEAEHCALAGRVVRAFRARGIGDLLAPRHAGLAPAPDAAGHCARGSGRHPRSGGGVTVRTRSGSQGRQP